MNNYEREKIEFEEHFSRYKEKRIVLYGIGRFSATLISKLSSWNIVGFMDKNPEKTGTYVYGLPILGLDEIKKKADLVIINTAEIYWNLIYQRIKHLDVPVYYRNGERAVDEENQDEIEYWNASYLQLKNVICSFDIISFDFFDTLFCRKTYMPSDVWEYVGDSLVDEDQKEKFVQLRKSVCGDISKETFHISEIYEKMPLDMLTLKEREVEEENKLTLPRCIMISLLKDIIAEGKEAYVISDMYLPTEFFVNKLHEYNIELPNECIWISCDCGFTKKNGGLWSKFRKEIVKDRMALHIGDNVKSDIEDCKKYAKIDTFFVMSQEEMLRRSSIKDCLRYTENIYHNMILGLCISRLFNNPFSLCDTNGTVKIDKRKDFGYTVFAPVIFTFLIWLLRSIELDSIHKLCFLGRDGFFLKKDFEYIYELLHCTYEMDISYLETSRQILMCASIENQNDFDEYMQMPYEGRFSDFFEDRLQIKLAESDSKVYDENISMPQDYDIVRRVLPRYKDRIISYIKLTKVRYKQYLKSFNLKNQDAVVDLGFYGTTQHYLSKILDKEFVGYYIVADKSDKNVLGEKHVLKSCTSISTDKSCKNAFIHSMGLAIESFLTSPHGMVKSIYQDGQFICAPDTNNQTFFEDKVEINEGVKLFIKDMIDLHYGRLNRLPIYIDDFVDNWYGLLLKNCIFGEEIKRSFYNDNAFIHRRQEKIFE